MLHRYGVRALLVDLADLGQVRAVDDALRADPLPGTLDVVPAARTVLVSFGSPGARAAGERGLARRVADATARSAPVVGRPAQTRQDPTAASSTPEPGATASGAPLPSTSPPVTSVPAAPVVELPVRYDGPDLAEVATLTGLDVEEVVRRHLAGRYTVAFGGFMPGFAYLSGLDPLLHVPRRDTPRVRVPAGAVAVAGEFTAVYPAATPGGWRILGTCDLPLFDVRRTSPALLPPGTSVRFVRVGSA
ncbi:MAG TPA: carboxyltransferase domain-containing protein [Cellulomonas sp.]